MSEEREMTDEERFEDLKRRQKDHVFMTTEEAVAWNQSRPKKPVSEKHWSRKASKITHVPTMGAAWKRLAKALWTDLRQAEADLKESQDISAMHLAQCKELRRMMIYCNKCSSGPGEACRFHCTRDGSRDNG